MSWSRPTLTVPASQVQPGDFLPGLDNGYVMEVSDNSDGYLSASTGYSRYTTALPGDTVAVTFHTAEGEEAYLFLPADTPVTVKRDVQN